MTDDDVLRGCGVLAVIGALCVAALVLLTLYTSVAGGPR